MSDFYTVTISGRATKDVELKTTTSGKEVCSFSVASNIGWGENQKTKFTNCVVWGNLAKTISDYVKKGTEVEVIGDLSVREYEHNGETKTIEEVKVNQIKWHNKDKVETSDPMSIEVDEELPF